MFEEIIVKPIFNALMLIYGAVPGGDFGVTIVIFTIITRFLMYPLVKKQLHQTKMMRKLQPELKKIKERAAGDKQQEALQMMELYKRYGVSPFRSIGLLIIQLPIFIGLYQVIQVMTMHRDRIAHFTYAPLESWEPIAKIISDPNNFDQKMLGFIDLTKTVFANNSVDITLFALAVIAGATQYIMVKQTMPTQDKPPKKFRDIMKEASEGKKHDQSDMNAMMMNNMMKIMPLMMFVIMLGLPGALALYYTVSNLVAVAQQHHLLSKDEDELEEIAEEVVTPAKAPKPSAINARAKKAKKANVTRITAKDTRKKGRKS